MFNEFKKINTNLTNCTCEYIQISTIISGQLFLDKKEDIIVDFLRRMMSKYCNVDTMLISDYFQNQMCDAQ